MYETWHPNAADPNRIKGKINYTVWSDVFLCPNCGAEMVFWDLAVDQKNGIISNDWHCPACGTLVAKSPQKASGALRAERAWETHFDRELKQTVRQARQVPVLINYSVGKKRYEKKPDAEDLTLIQKIEEMDIPYWVPTNKMPEGFNTEQPKISHGLTHVHHFYSRRNLYAISALISSQHSFSETNSKLFLDGIQTISTSLVSKLTRYKYKKSGNSMLSGTLYVASTIAEQNVFKVILAKLEDIFIAKRSISPNQSSILTRSSTHFNIDEYKITIFSSIPLVET